MWEIEEGLLEKGRKIKIELRKGEREEREMEAELLKVNSKSGLYFYIPFRN